MIWLGTPSRMKKLADLIDLALLSAYLEGYQRGLDDARGLRILVAEQEAARKARDQ